MKRRIWGIVLVVALALSSRDPLAQSTVLRPIMREKLANTQQLLEGVLTANFAMIERYGDRLGQITYTEVASWQANAEPEYLRNASAFLKAVQGIRAAAADHNAQRAAAEYTNLISACVACHTYVRASRVAGWMSAPRHEDLRASDH